MSKTKIVNLSIIAVLLVVLIVINAICGVMAETIDRFLVGGAVADDETLAKNEALGEELAELIEGEGIVLLQNKDNLLPMNQDEVTAVNVFGWGATQWVAGGSGSGRVVAKKGAGYADTGILEALEAINIEYNTELIDMYRRFCANRPHFGEGTLNAWDHEYYRIIEPDIEKDYTEEMLANAEAFSNTAIVVITRVAGESSDAPKVQYKGNSTSDRIDDETRTYLEISTEEEAMLEYVGSTFENVIVLINSTNTMELGFLESIDGLDAALMVGATGVNAATAIPKVIFGDINPSGRLADTYAYELETAASYANSGMAGLNLYTNGNGLYPADGTTQGNLGQSGIKYPGVAYVDYKEGIYVGYKWYETADAEGFWDSYGGYDAVVQYPFGYGLSYTTFEWEVVNLSIPNNSKLAEDDTIEVTVRVTNTGDVAGKEVVQLYYTAPYTKGGIEKASVNLCAFAKTQIIDPGHYEDLKLSVKVEDMASYDVYDSNANGNIGYELDAGAYQLKLMKNAHEVAEINSTMSLMKEEGVIDYRIDNEIFYNTDSATGNIVENRLTGDDSMDGASIDGSHSGVEIVWLTRADFEGTFPELSEARAITDIEKYYNLYTSQMANDYIDSSDEPITTNAKNNMPVYANGEFTQLGLDLGADYNHEDWDAVLDQLTFDEMKKLVLHGYTHLEALASIGMPKATDADGPQQIGSFNFSRNGVGFPNATTMAQTFNSRLIYEFGIAFGNEAKNLSFDGWYGPGINMHRSPFGGRNYEYYSEDSFLTGTMGANAVKGAKNAGVYSYLKHLALYEQESYRDGCYTWLTEQALREIYLKPFRMCIVDGGSTGIMTSYGRIGGTWTGGSRGLLTGIVRDEWGFNGVFLTDYADHQKFMNIDQALRAGGDLWMDGYQNNGNFRMETSSNTFNQELRRASKNIIYMRLNAAYTASIYDPSQDGVEIHKGEMTEVFSWWIPVLIGFDVLSLGGLGFWGYKTFTKREEEAPVNIDEDYED